MKAFRLGKSKKNSKGQLRKDTKSLNSPKSNASLRSNLKNDKNQSYTNSLYNSMNRNPSITSPSSTNVPITSSNSYTNYMANGSNNNSINRKNSSSPKAISRNISASKNQVVPEFRVGIRLRPMLETEKEDIENNEELVYLFPQNNILCIREPGSDRLPEIDDGPPPPPGTIAPSMGPYISTNPFNYVFGSPNSQEDVYFQSVHPLVEHFHHGKNSLVLAYGQMGSGKTYTIGFQPEDYNLENFQPDILNKDLGFVPRAFQETLSYIQLLKSQGRSASLLVTFIAISCEDIADLLGESITRYRRPPSPGPKMSSPNDKRDPTTQPKTITVHDRGKQGTYLKGAKYERVESMERLAELLYRGTTFRRIVYGPDSENLSHAILSFQLEQDNPKTGKDKIYSKLNFVDLSCTEKIDKVEARMNRMECGVNDKSWLALSKVINLLTANRPKGYIPYRDSKLTQVLQDSLSGDSIVLFLSCLSPTACDENKSVLKYMIRSTNIDQRKTDVSPKLLKSIIYNLETILDTPPTSPISPMNINSNQSSLSRVVNVDGSVTNSLNLSVNINGSMGNTLNRSKGNFESPINTNHPSSSLKEDDAISPGGSSIHNRPLTNPNQNLEINTSISSMSRLAANSSLLFGSPDLDISSPVGNIYEDEIKRKSMGYNNSNSTTLERIPRRQINKRTSSLNHDESLSKIQNRVSQASNVPSINSIHSSLVNDRKNSNTGMTQMLEEQLKTLDSLAEETSSIESHMESKEHRRKNSEGKKRMSLHKRLLSFQKAISFDINSGKSEESNNNNNNNNNNNKLESTPGSQSVTMNEYNEMLKLKVQNEENINNHIAFMLEEIQTTIGEKVKQYPNVNDETFDANSNSVYNLDKLVYYLKVLLQNYSKNQDQVKKLTALINNSNIVNNSNYPSNPLSAVVSDVENLKFIENVGNPVSNPILSRSNSLDIANIPNGTPPPSHPPPPLPIESPTMPPTYKNFKNNNNSNKMKITTNNIINSNGNNGNNTNTTTSNGSSSKNNNIINGNTNTNGNIRINNNTPHTSVYNMDITSDIEVSDEIQSSINISNDELSPYARKNNAVDHDLSAIITKGKSVLKNSSVYNNNNNNNNNNNGSSIMSPNAYSEDMVMEDMDQAELNKYITNLSMRLKNSINEVKEEKEKCDLLRQKERNLERKLRIRDKELEALHAELDEKINSFNNAVKVLVMQLGMAQESKNKTQEELSTVEYRSMELAKSLETISELMNGERKNTRNAEDKYYHFVAEYEEEINLLQGEKSQIMHEKESLQQQNANLQSKINKLVKTLKKFQVNLIESEKRNYYDASANLTNLKNENNLLKRKLDEINQTKTYIENRYRQLQVEYEKQQAMNMSSSNRGMTTNNYYGGQDDNQSNLVQKVQEYEKELEQLKAQLRETEEAHQTEVYKLLDRLAVAEGNGNKSKSGMNNNDISSNTSRDGYIAELEKKLEKSYSVQNELKEKLKSSEALISKKAIENKELEGKCLSYKKSLNTLQNTVSTYENHQTKLLNTNYNLSSQLQNGKKGKSITTRSYSGFRTIMHDIKKMTVTELQDEVVELRQEVESMNKKNWDLKLEVDRYQSANESNRRTIMLLMKRINGDKKKEEDTSTTLVEGDDSHNSSFGKEPSSARNSNSSMNSKHESNTTLLNSESYDDDYSKSTINKLPVLNETDDEVIIHEESDEDATANVSPYLINKSNSSSSSTAVNLPIHAISSHEGYLNKDNETRSISEASSSSDFSMIKVNDEVCIRESTISTDSMKYTNYHNY
eukprot:jgi/Orpsp1_1/1177677/evm.model.c7180000062391.1